MKTTQRNTITIMALALLIAAMPLASAQATVRVRATVKTPHLKYKVTPSSVVVSRNRRVCHHPVRYQETIRLTKKDRKMAKRLARYTGASKRELLELRRDGYSWRKIGRFLNLRPQVVRAAQSKRSWKQFLYGPQVQVVRCGNH